ncbi:NAD-dependent epimerase/dehydratase family protein [Aeromicrobium ginsengisoli]|uniref:NAD(P)-dependent oxidoreductase n=1 Tax=Aeromicrobium ginsengisoli TaxID=363867 RepID=A0A5M4FFK6_9ACTN|nr:NAD(P)-dependent oxidoreductase [Aeromicrobium ginsengisoli]KAA1398018.1 NAD(P)-dependent oxidoreductase [Aeromicrobium ginsengisoli]
MILVTGGLGFIGAHVCRALLDLGESCVAAQRSMAAPPAFLIDVPEDRLVLDTVDCVDEASVLALGRRHRITGIVHLASARLGQGDPLDELDRATASTLTMLRAARKWGARRMVQASTIGVYAGVDEQVYREDAMLPVSSPRALQANKKIAEILAHAVSGTSGLDVVSARIGAVWGPLGRERSPFFGLPQLVHGAVRASAMGEFLHEDDGIDAIHVRDCARAIALLQVAPRLNHQTYNIGRGEVTTNRDVVNALRSVTGRAAVELLPGRSPHLPPADTHMDVSRLSADTGFKPELDLERGIRAYADWLAAGHER